MGKNEDLNWLGKTKDKEKLEIIKILADDKGLSIKQLAEKSGVSHESIYNYIKGETRPQAISLYKIAKALDTTVEYILEFELSLKGDE